MRRFRIYTITGIRTDSGNNLAALCLKRGRLENAAEHLERIQTGKKAKLVLTAASLGSGGAEYLLRHAEISLRLNQSAILQYRPENNILDIRL